MNPMKLVFGLLFLVAASMFAQEPGKPPPRSTPPTFPQEQVPREQMPPDQQAPPERLSAVEVQQQIQQGLNSESALRNSRVGVRVDENSVVLTGTVESEQQHELALRIAQSYAGDRKIVDKIELKHPT